ncbi:hypothetical protein BCR42DRAFT_451588 [Absidia repens]|uniref:Zinc finger PHD-type domain-containing protein n=1 Tax=Absidia repens TaxID=90262 RepID=A0A1X2IFF6_9FUNG|nr:hypothetical protein BCR42DRAFT_451588 [Absidia repens]
MATPLSCSSSSSDMVQTEDFLAKNTSSTPTNAITTDDTCPHATETRYFTKETMDQQHIHHQQSVSEIPSMPFLPELILSTWLQSECNLTQSPIIIQPIHHTLENATITYDTLVEQQKELVKDVFFSPAMQATNTTTISSSLSSTSSSDSLGTLATTATSASATASFSPPTASYTSTPSSCSDDEAATLCGSQTDGESTQSRDDDFSPSDLLLEQDDSFLFFGALDFDLDNQQQQEQQHKELKQKQKPTTALTNSCVESTVALSRQSSALKRKRNGAVASTSKNDHSFLAVFSPKSTPPMSPNEHQWDYFDASGEDSSSDDDGSDDAGSTSLDYRMMKTDFQYISVQDDFLDSDDDSISSWENRRANMFDDADVNDIKAKTKQTLILKNTKPNKKKISTKHAVPTSNNNNTAATISTAKKQKQQPKKVKVASSTAPPVFAYPESHEHLEKIDPRPTCHPTLYQKLTKKNVDWCRYCGTTEGVNWRPGPWGKRTLCNKHGCDYKGYGFACKLPRLNLTDYVNETIHDRDRPVLQFYCATCHRMESWATNVLVRCEGCYKSYHQKCYQGEEQPLTDAFVSGDQPWYCDKTCRDNVACGRVVVEISRKRLPLMCAPTKSQVQASLIGSSSSSSSTSNGSTSNHRYTSTSTDRATRNACASQVSK